MHPTQISQWKRQLGAEAKEIFGSRRFKEVRAQEVVQASLYEEIGRLTMELEWVVTVQADDEADPLIDLTLVSVRRGMYLAALVTLPDGRQHAA